MVSEIQRMRRSQFVLTYGPGSIIESRYGPRLIPSVRHGVRNTLLTPDYFEKNLEITDNRLRMVLKDLTGKKSRIFSLPSEASDKKFQNKPLYDTYVFPVWKICYGSKDTHKPILFNGEKSPRCPLCGKEKDYTAVRFVVACIDGHLDDVNWNYVVHRNKKECIPRYYYWKARGSSLSDICIKCPECESSTTMKDIYDLGYYQGFPCTSRLPEQEHRKSGHGPPFYVYPERKINECDKKMRIVQRQSSSLRIAETISLLTVPKYDNAISNILQKLEISSAISAILETLSILNHEVHVEEFIKMIKNSLKNQPQNTVTEIENYIKENGINKCIKLFHDLHDEDKKFLDFIYEEYESLIGGHRIGETEYFSVASPTLISESDDGILPALDIYPIPRIRTITAQMGYRRLYSEEDKESKRISVGLYLDGDYWYPGYEGIGEGVFINLSQEGSINLNGKRGYEEWKKSIKMRSEFAISLWGDILQDPLFVWLHTLSHSIIESLSSYAGYTSASLRERIYLNRPERNSGGILIYTTSPGEEGSMGGLVGTVPVFETILKMAIDRIKFCSNDVLCHDVRKEPGKENGAACHSCLFISETSCEHRNRWLDRHLILGD